VGDQLGIAESDIVFVEPDIIHDVFHDTNGVSTGQAFGAGEDCSATQQDGGHGKAVGPSDAWHLGDNFSQLATARTAVQFGNPLTRIAHIDTGYFAAHVTVPNVIRHDLERSFVEGDKNPNSAQNPGIPAFLLDNHDHGTGTLSILAGGKVPALGTVLGGAPDAEIVPLRVADSVVLLRTSALARALVYATRQGCDVVTLSMGGLPSNAWAEAVDNAYDAGLCICAAAGNHKGSIPPRVVVYPARYHRVIAVCGVMANFTPYAGLSEVLEGSFGPKSVMKAAIAAFTPNIPWARFGCKDVVRLNGEGTSAATPQVAAAVALWFEKYKTVLPRNYQRIEAVRHALFSTADHKDDAEHYGNGVLRARAALDVPPLLNLPKSARSDNSFAFLRVVTGLGIVDAPPREMMFNLELAQRWLVNPRLQEIVADPEVAAELSPDDMKRVMEAVIEDTGASVALRKHVASRFPIIGGGSAPRTELSKEVVAEVLPACDVQPALTDPPYRRIRVYALDPSLSARLDTADINEVALKIRWEKLSKGPSGEYVCVEDIDAKGIEYTPVDLDDPRLLAQDGWAPSEGNPQFHQQMAYAVSMKTIQHFETALGRPVLWRPKPNLENPFDDSGFIAKLSVKPHALRQANAYYSPQLVALLFGYFEASAQVEDWLGGAYDIEKRVAIRLPGYPQEELKEVLRAYLAVRRLDPTGERVLVRTFQLRSPNVLTAQLMGFMWDRERRALATLSPTTAGKALLGFREARRIEDQHVALLVTEWPGTETLRSLLHGNPHPSLRQQKGRVDFWRQFTPILNAIDALHGSGFLHRSLSPEAIYDQSVQQNDSAAIPLSSTLRLCHFEWSVYLRGLGGLGKYRRQALNRYVAPEALRAALAISSGQRGETFGSDLYALGLTLFECMIRPFRGEEELRLYSSPEAYDEAEQEAHRAWLQALRTEVRAAHRNGTIESFERDLLLGDGRRFGLLEFEVAQRLATLAPIVAVIHEFALRAQFDINEPLPVFTTLSTRHSDPRADLRCIAYYLARYLPEVDTASDLSAIALARIITNDLRGASVFINREPRSPLLLRSRTGTMYRLKTFSWDGQERHDVAYLEMARHWEGDEPAGDVIGTLHESVKVHDIDMGSAAIYRFLGAHREKAWVDFFSLALEWKPAMVQESQSRDRRAQLVDVLGLSTEVDYELAWNEAQFVRVGNGLQIRAPAGEKKNLAVLVSTWLSRDLRLEVTRLRVPFGEGIEIGLGLESLDIEAGTVDLSGEISADLLPQEGVLRPSGNRGISALYRRRKEVLRQLREDTVLLDSAVDPSDGVRELAKDAFGHVEFSLPQLDGEKRRIVEAYRRVRPLLVVQGPPGTGKTTLATEVILQTLAEASNTRVLIASQGHAPLDNLLERLLTEKDRNSAAKQKLERAEIVRLPSGNRRAQDYPERVREHLPYERADRLFRELRRDSAKNQNALGLTGVVARSVLDALKPFQSAPNSLRRRIEESANLVFVTTSAREIETAIPGSFDFVIVEEAARCAPIELLGVMRLARHWLLIGDHQQLPPFGFEMTVGAVDRRLEALILDAENGQSQKLTQSDSRVDTEGTRLRAIQRNAPTYMELFKHLHASGGAKAAMTLRTQWRMHPALGSMISDVFYDSLAVTNPIGSDLQGLIKRTTHPFREPSFLRNQQLIWIDFDSAVDDPACGESRGAGGELENSAERRTLVAFLRQLQSDRPSHDLAVLTPYRRQAEQLRGLLSERYNRFDAFGTIEDRIATVDSFQGRQAGTVILSLVRNNNLVHHRSSVGFLSESQRATVMFSRSERLLVILGCSAHFKRFQETSWMMEIYDRAYHIDWKNILPSAERRKLER